jgi:hypothetical protein
MNAPLKVRSCAATLAAVCLLCTISGAGASPVRASALSAIIGTFDCVTLDGDKISHFHSVNVAWGAWVRADTLFAPQNGQPEDRRSVFVGYDVSAKRWNIVALDMDGTYYTRYSRSPYLNGSRWLNSYPVDNAKAIIRTYGGSRYTFSLNQPATNGQPADSSMTTCTRV